MFSNCVGKLMFNIVYIHAYFYCHTFSNSAKVYAILLVSFSNSAKVYAIFLVLF